MGGSEMSVKYIKLWKVLLDKGMKRTDLIEKTGISANVLAMESVEKIFKALHCDIGEIMEITEDDD